MKSSSKSELSTFMNELGFSEYLELLASASGGETLAQLHLLGHARMLALGIPKVKVNRIWKKLMQMQTTPNSIEEKLPDNSFDITLPTSKNELATPNDLNELLDYFGLCEKKIEVETAIGGSSLQKLEAFGLEAFVSLGIPRIKANKLWNKLKDKNKEGIKIEFDIQSDSPIFGDKTKKSEQVGSKYSSRNELLDASREVLNKRVSEYPHRQRRKSGAALARELRGVGARDWASAVAKNIKLDRNIASSQFQTGVEKCIEELEEVKKSIEVHLVGAQVGDDMESIIKTDQLATQQNVETSLPSKVFMNSTLLLRNKTKISTKPGIRFLFKSLMLIQDEDYSLNLAQICHLLWIGKWALGQALKLKKHIQIVAGIWNLCKAKSFPTYLKLLMQTAVVNCLQMYFMARLV